MDKTTLDTEQNDLEIDNLPNRLTIFRILLIPIVCACLLTVKYDFKIFSNYKALMGWVSGWLFTIASVTDFFDGYIARKRNIVTVFGSFLDPIADKFLVVSSLILLGSLDRIPIVLVIILVLREMYMTSLRLLAMNEGLNVPVNQFGKWKTFIQMAGIPMLMAYEDWHIIPMGLIGIILIYIASFLSLYSAFDYSFGLVKKLKKKRMIKKQRGKST